MKARYLSYAGIVSAVLSLLPLLPLYLRELMAALTLALGIVAMWRGDKRWGLVVLIIGILLVLLTIATDFLFVIWQITAPK